MNSQTDKESAGHVKAAIIGGIFAIIAACIAGGFLILNTMVENGVIIFGASNPSNPNLQTTMTASPNEDQPINPSITDFPNVAPSPTVEIQQATLQIFAPLRPHQTSAVGTGVFTQVTSSDGNAPYSQDELNTNYYKIIRIRAEENPDGCGVSIYDTDIVWFSGSSNTVFTINGKEIGRLSVNTGKHGYVANWSIKNQDVVCASGYSASGFHIIFGPDMYYHYDSFCYRGYC